MRFLGHLEAGEQWSTGMLGTAFDKLWKQTLIFYSASFIVFKTHTASSVFTAGEDGGVTPD